MTELPLSVMLPLARGVLAVGRTRTFCHVSEQVTPLLLTLFKLNFICVVVDSPGGSPVDSMRLANYLAGLYAPKPAAA